MLDAVIVIEVNVSEIKLIGANCALSKSGFVQHSDLDLLFVSL